MQVPLEISYRNIRKNDDIDDLIREKVKKLERVCDHITSCRAAIEKPIEAPNTGNPFRVRLDIRVPPGHSVIVRREPGEGVIPNNLSAVIRDAFEAAKKQLERLSARQRADVKTHPQQEVTAIVSQVFPDEGYGFLQTINGREIYFHKNSILHNKFDELKPGTGVRFFEEEGEKGMQASSVLVIENPKL